MNIFKNSLLFAIIYFNIGSIFAQNPRAKVFITTPVISLQNAAGTNIDQVLNVDFKIEDKSFNTSGNFISNYTGYNLNNSLIAFSDIDFYELSNINIPVKLTANTADGNNSISDKINYTLPLHNLEFDANNKFDYTNTTSAGNIWTIQFRTDVDYYFEGELKLKQTHYRIKSADKIPTIEIIPTEGIHYQWQNGNAKGKISGSQGQFYTPSPEEVNRDKSGMYYISVAAIHPGNKEITSEASRIGIIVDPSIDEANVLDCPEIATAIASPSSTCGGTVNLSITTIPNASGGSYVEGTNYFLKWYLNGVLILNGLGADNSFGTADDRYNLRNTTYTVPSYSGTQCGTQDLIFTAEIYCLKTGDSTKQGNPISCDNTAGNIKKQFGGCGTLTGNGYTNGCPGVSGSQGPTGMGNYFNPCTGLFNFTTFQTCSGNPGAAQFLLDLSVLPACSEVSRVTYDVMGSSDDSCNSRYSSSWASEANLIFYSPDANPTSNNSPGSFLWSNAGYTMCGTPNCNTTGGSFRFNRTLTFPAGTSASGIWRLVLFDDYNDGGTYADGEVNYLKLRVDYYMSPACLLSAIPGAVVKMNTNTVKLYDPINVGANFTIPGACETKINPICSNLGILYSNNNGGTYTLSSPPTPVSLGQTVYYQAKYISPGAPTSGCPVTGTYTITGTSIPANAGRDTMLTCSLTSVKIGSPAQTGKTYSWTPIIGLDNPLIAQPTVNAPGTYYLTLTDTTTGCFGKDTIIVSGDVSIPNASAGLNKTLTCSVTSVPIGMPNDPNNTYTWSPANGLNSNLISNPIATAPGTYTLTVKNIASGCTATDQVTITIDTIKPFANAGTDRVLTCANTVFVLGTNNVPANSYAWTPAAGLNNPAIANPRDSLPNTYYLTVTNNSNGCIDKDTVVVTQNITPPLANAGPNQLLNCYDKVFVLGTANDSANTYKWTP
ncbi:MAG: hypothetical protein IT271_09400, partial [Chitinophagales bacterium]|nr:hypothetical protein [Chitinophagales bacterium]